MQGRAGRAADQLPRARGGRKLSLQASSDFGARMKDTGRAVRQDGQGSPMPCWLRSLSQAGSLQAGSRTQRWLMDIRAGKKRDLSLRAGLADGQESLAYGISDQRALVLHGMEDRSRILESLSSRIPESCLSAFAFPQSALPCSNHLLLCVTHHLKT